MDPTRTAPSWSLTAIPPTNLPACGSGANSSPGLRQWRQGSSPPGLRRALIPDVQAELWPDATHSIAGQYATEVNERVLRFINSVGAATPTP
ncbi:hypothetical protein [Sphaerisporangium siamense]|uniref:Alpha/beta hydrolase n=1 Tax=Sphaerisporangium siamense TaxID=795645 RepID=A0A7W7GBF2_9ACTN|nr:hypothetical protein [Sphaerisporangium siamense]MBB4700931.1 hypothetical protein [Sphaerisporangium siamense]